MEKSRVTSTPFFPDEIMFNIFLFVPAHILHNVMRYICRQWYSIIQDPNFVSTHFLHSTETPLVKPKISGPARILEVNKCGIDLREFKLQFNGEVLSSCNGLILIYAIRSPRLRSSYLIGNPATNRILALPPSELAVPFEYSCGLAFAPLSKVYKVVMVYRSSEIRPDLGCVIFTVGEDNAWRLINCADLNQEIVNYFLSTKPITSAEFLYWYCQGSQILTLDVEAERFKFILLPKAIDRKKGVRYFLTKGNSVSFFQVDHMNYSMDVWVLKDHETEEWMKLSSFKIEVPRLEWEMNARYPGSRSFWYPVCWLRTDEMILFRVHSCAGCLFVYDLKIREGFSFTHEGHLGSIIPYTNSLAWL